MQTSAAGIELIKRSEGFADKPYPDAGGVSIGYGHHILNQVPDCWAQGIDLATAERILTDDVESAEDAVGRLVKVALTQGQFDALIDFTFNLGSGKLAGSTLLKKLNAKDYDGAAQQLLLWDHLGAGPNAPVSPGLKARREQEFALWKGQPA
jgi:lysozyme